MQYLKFNYTQEDTTKKTIDKEEEENENYVDVLNMTDEQIMEMIRKRE
jgi:hypothetical protein